MTTERFQGTAKQDKADESEEVNMMEGKPKHPDVDQEEQRVAEEENTILQKEQDEVGVEVCKRKQTGWIQSQRPQSFLYSHHQNVSGLRATSHSTHSSSCTCFNPPQPSNITHSLTLRKLRGERV